MPWFKILRYYGLDRSKSLPNRWITILNSWQLINIEWEENIRQQIYTLLCSQKRQQRFLQNEGGNQGYLVTIKLIASIIYCCEGHGSKRAHGFWRRWLILLPFSQQKITFLFRLALLFPCTFGFHKFKYHAWFCHILLIQIFFT